MDSIHSRIILASSQLYPLNQTTHNSRSLSLTLPASFTLSILSSARFSYNRNCGAYRSLIPRQRWRHINICSMRFLLQTHTHTHTPYSNWTIQNPIQCQSHTIFSQFQNVLCFELLSCFVCVPVCVCLVYIQYFLHQSARASLESLALPPSTSLPLSPYLYIFQSFCYQYVACLLKII